MEVKTRRNSDKGNKKGEGECEHALGVVFWQEVGMGVEQAG